MAKNSSDAPDRDELVDPEPLLAANSDARSRYGRFNLAIVGGTGVGKSSLVNAVFQRDLAKVGVGLPITEGVRYYSDESLGIWDMEGFEIGSTDHPAEQLKQHLDEISARPDEEQISVVWYCVASSSARLTKTDIALIQALDSAKLPVVLVLTKVRWSRNPLGSYRPSEDAEKFFLWLEENHGPLDLRYKKAILTSARGDREGSAGHGLGELVAETLSLAPDGDKDAFRVAQRLNLPWKREMARPIIAASAGASAAAAAIPIPVADALALAPIQLAMMGRIAAIYDLDLKQMMSAGAIAQLATQIAGKAAARGIVKLIPGAGSAINASVAFALTAAAGEAWLRVCEKVHIGEIDLADVSSAWKQYSPALVTVLKKIAEYRSVRGE